MNPGGGGMLSQSGVSILNERSSFGVAQKLTQEGNCQVRRMAYHLEEVGTAFQQEVE